MSPPRRSRVRSQRARNDVVFSLSTNTCELFAFGASSHTATVGGVNNMAGLGGVFDVAGSRNLAADLGPNSRFNNLNTGHSAQFVHSFLDVQLYWRELRRSIE